MVDLAKKLTGIFFGPGWWSLNSLMWINSEWQVSLGPPDGLNDLLEMFFVPAWVLKKYLPTSLYSSPIAFETSLLNVSVVVDLPRLLEKFLSFPISLAGLRSF